MTRSIYAADSAQGAIRATVLLVVSTVVSLFAATAFAQPETSAPAQPQPAAPAPEAAKGAENGAETEPVGPVDDEEPSAKDIAADDPAADPAAAAKGAEAGAGQEDAQADQKSATVGFGDPAAGSEKAPEKAPEDGADKPSPLLSEARHKIDAGGFLGGNYLSRELELGNSYFDDQVPGSAFLLGLRGTYLLIPHLMPESSLDPSLSVEVEAKLAFSSTAGATDEMRGSYSSPVLGWRAHAVLSIWNERKLRPFAVLGIGGETAFSSSPFVYSVDTDAELHWGLGATYKIADAYGVRADFRHGITAGRFALAASTVEFHAGFYYSFGFGKRQAGGGDERPELDPKRVKEMNDNDPDIVVEALPEPKNLDTDGDGINDVDDKCPQEAETVNEIDDEDGCPEADRDGDKVVDSRDQCPDIAEDPDEYQDEDGCPDRDDDGDGRPDSVDECPNKPEVLNGFEDENGCPDEVPADVQSALQSLLFRPRGATVKTLKKRLDPIVTVLKQHPSIQLRVIGHADGSERKAKPLSEKRAAAVKDYLVAAGIDAGRFETQGHGSEKPITKSRTRSGKARNRRVEFELVPGPASIPDPTAPPTAPAPAAPTPGQGGEAPAGAAGGTGPGTGPSTGSGAATPDASAAPATGAGAADAKKPPDAGESKGQSAPTKP